MKKRCNEQQIQGYQKTQRRGWGDNIYWELGISSGTF